MVRTQIQTVLLFGLSCFLITSCGEELRTTQNLKSVVKPPLKWADPSNIPVCFVNESEVEKEVIVLIKEILKKEYEGRTVIRFTGFGHCPAKTNSVIRVRLNNELENGEGVSLVGDPKGKLLKAKREGVGDETLQLGVATWPEEKRDLKTSTLHEFGHALALDHEHERSDRPKVCKLGKEPFDDIVKEGDDGAIYIGPYDAKSIMDYCFSGITLSKGDLEGIAHLYGAGK